jgi:hypothetical protein
MLPAEAAAFFVPLKRLSPSLPMKAEVFELVFCPMQMDGGDVVAHPRLVVLQAGLL